MRRRRSRSPFQRPRVPRIIARYFSSKERDNEVPNENERCCGHKESADGREHVHPSPVRQVRISEHAPRHPVETQKMLNNEGHVEADNHQPERPLAEPLREHPSTHFRKPILNASNESEEDRACGNEVKMRYEKIAVLCLPIERHDRMADSRYSGAKELNEKGDAKQHRHIKANPPAEHCCRPIEHFHAGWNRDQQGSNGKKRIGGAAHTNRKHVVAPNTHAQDRDCHTWTSDKLVAQHPFPGENRDKL